MDRCVISAFCHYIDQSGIVENLFTYTTIGSPSEGIFTDKGSKFIGYLYPISSEEEFKNALKGLRTKHAGARHFCYAYRIGKSTIIERSNDDGEPSGTAGKPIFNQLLSYQLMEVGLVVVRYFGGTLLGTTGLIQAYKGASKAAIEQATIIEKPIILSKEMEIPYPLYNQFMALVKKYEIKSEMIRSSEQETCFTLDIPLKFEEKFMEELKKIRSV